MMFFELGRVLLYVQKYCMMKNWSKLIKTDNYILKSFYTEMPAASNAKIKIKLIGLVFIV